MDEARRIAGHAANSLEIANRIRNIYIEDAASPWNEKALIKRKKDHLDVKMTVWKDDLFLYGRVFRLLLYVYDVLDPQFRYQPETAPDENREPKIRNRHNQIWTIYVDSRLERKGIETFYDKTVRRNIFVDAEKEFSWVEASKIFERLWGKENLVYREIADYAYSLGKLKEEDAQGDEDALEVEINKFLLEPDVRSHIERIPSPRFRDSVNELLSFAAYHCKDTHVEPSHFGIAIIYQKRVIMEMVPSRENKLFLTLFDATSNCYDTRVVKEDTNIKEVQRYIRDMYGKVSADQRF